MPIFARCRMLAQSRFSIHNGEHATSDSSLVAIGEFHGLDWQPLRLRCAKLLMSKSNVDDILEDGDEDRHFDVDFGTELQLEIGGVDPRLRSIFVGMERGRFIVVRTPTMSELGGIEVKLFGGNRVVVRFVYSGTVFGFETSIIEAVSSPFRLLYLAYPKVVNERNIRSNRRVNTTLPAKLGSGENTCDGTVTDISITGCQFETRTGRIPDSLGARVGSDIDITLQLPGVAGEFQITGQIKNIRKEGKNTELGVAFGDLEENVQLAIDEYVKLSD